MFSNAVKVKDLKKGAFFTLRSPEKLDVMPEHRVYIRGEYDRTDKSYECVKFDDISRFLYLKGDKIVYTDFTF